MVELEFSEELRNKITKAGTKYLKIVMNDTYAKFKYPAMWKDLDDWAVANKYPSWRKQKNYIISMSSSYGISLPITAWKKIFKIYDELHKKFYFLGWDIDCIPWLEKKIIIYSTVE